MGVIWRGTTARASSEGTMIYAKPMIHGEGSALPMQRRSKSNAQTSITVEREKDTAWGGGALVLL